MISQVTPQKKTGRPKTKFTGERVCEMSLTPTVYAMVQEMATGHARELMVVGTRGDGKTIGVLAGMLAHAGEHQRQGYPLPVKWIGFTDTFSAHKAKTFESLQKPFWKGCWRPSDGGHVWTALVNGVEVVQLFLFGIEDQGAMDRVRTECAGVWCEEPAPTAVEGVSRGVDETVWGMSLTSQRLPSHRHVAVMTLNYPDEDHWTWQRFLPGSGVTGRHPLDDTRQWFRIPPGERAKPEQRAEWAHALRDRPDLRKRLIEGQPGSLLLGQQVADGFREDLHVSPERVYPIPGEPLLIGLDFGHTPCAVIGQPYRGQRRICAALVLERGGVKQLLENEVIPWLSRHAPWWHQPGALVGCYDVAGQTDEQSDIDRDPIGVVETLLPGLWFPGPVRWEPRHHTLLSAMQHHAGAGQVSLRVDPVDARELVKALSGRWCYATDRMGQVRRDLPKKPNHPWEDLGDAFIYWLWGLTSEAGPPKPVRVETDFTIGSGPSVQSSFSV